VLNSFSAWTLISRDKIPCCCGQGWKTRTVEIEVCLNHVLKVDGKTLTVKQLVGVKSEDKDHAVNHYDFQSASKAVDGLRIIWVCENSIQLGEGDVFELKNLSLEKAETFNAEGLKKFLLFGESDQSRGMVM